MNVRKNIISIFSRFTISIKDLCYLFSWEPALGLANSQDAAEEVKKTIAIFGYKQRDLSIQMKTKVVQHVPRINLSYFKFQIFKFFQIFSGSQLLSDFQTFFC